jgi:hypothetical protein
VSRVEVELREQLLDRRVGDLDQPVAFGALGRRPGDREPVDEVPLVVVLVVEVSPHDPSRHDRRTEGGVLGPVAGEHAEESAAVLMEMGQVLGGGELAVGEIEEVAAAWTTTAKAKVGMSASKRRSRQRPTRSSLSEGN